MIKILVSDPLSEEGLKVLKSIKDFQVDVKTELKPEELKSVIKGYEALLVRSATKVTRDIIEAADKLKVIGRAGVGLDNVDLAAATQKGVIVMNTPGGNTISTAEHTMSMILALSRNIPQATANFLGSLPLPRVVVMMLIAFVFLIGGSIIDDMAFAILAIPVFLPTAIKLGFDPIWFLVFISIVIGIGVLIPPVAVGVFIVHKMSNEPLSLIYRGVIPFLVALLLCTALVFVFPQLITWLAYSAA